MVIYWFAVDQMKITLFHSVVCLFCFLIAFLLVNGNQVSRLPKFPRRKFYPSRKRPGVILVPLNFTLIKKHICIMLKDAILLRSIVTRNVIDFIYRIIHEETSKCARSGPWSVGLKVTVPRYAIEVSPGFLLVQFFFHESKINIMHAKHNSGIWSDLHSISSRLNERLQTWPINGISNYQREIYTRKNVYN